MLRPHGKNMKPKKVFNEPEQPPQKSPKTPDSPLSWTTDDYEYAMDPDGYIDRFYPNETSDRYDLASSSDEKI